MSREAARKRASKGIIKSKTGRTALLKARVFGAEGDKPFFTEEEDELVALAKAGGPGEGRQHSNAATLDQTQSFKLLGALVPNFDPRDLCELYRESAALRPNIDAYVTNIDGHGSHFVPVINLKGDDARDKVRDAIYLERLHQQEEGEVVASLEPSDEEVDERIEDIERQMRVEKFRIQAFFESCVVEEPFVQHRKRTRQDKEITGNAYWEVLREDGKPVQFVYLPVCTVRAMPIDPTPVTVEMPVRVSPYEYGTVPVRRRFRRYVQITEMGHQTWFKEWGDPRVISAKTGAEFPDEKSLKAKEGDTTLVATEVLHFTIPVPDSVYGEPRYVGNLYNLLGITKFDEVNYLYADNKAVPPLAILVSGGRLTEDSAQLLEDFIEEEIKGAENFHKILVIEAEPAANADGTENTGRMKLEIKPLTSAQLHDGQFMKYEERGTDRTGMSFRLPRLLRGDSRDFNRSTAESALKFTESQVFGPERNDFDALIQRVVLIPLGIRYWTFASNAPQISNPEDMARVIADLSKAGVLWPQLALELAAELVFNRELPILNADWMYQPIMLTQTGVGADMARDGKIPTPGGAAGGESAGADGDVEKSEKLKERAKALEAALRKARGGKMGRASAGEMQEWARELRRMRKALEKVEEEEAEAEFEELKKEETAPEPERKVIKMPAEALAKAFAIEPLAVSKKEK